MRDEVTIIAREALNNFIKTWGIEPHGIVMHNSTYERWISQRPSFHPKLNEDEEKKFRGLQIYRTSQIEENKIRFVL